MTHKYSEYMHWAKTNSRARFNLATSGVGAFPLSELPALPPLEINGDNSYGYPALKHAIAEKHGVDPDCVVTAAGTSMANYLAFASLLDAGDEVLIEHPTYGLLVDALRYLRVDLKTFPRREERGWALDPAEIRQALTPRTKLIVVTNLHNPTSVLTGEDVLREIGEMGPRVLVDEVYLDAVYDNTPRSAFHLGPQFVVTNSLTKLYGVSGLRCGWILAAPELARAMERLNDLFGATPVYPGEVLSVAVLRHLPEMTRRYRQILDADRCALRTFFGAHPSVDAVCTPWGTTCFVRLFSGDVDFFLESLREEQDTSAVPGSFFGMPNHFRIGMGVNSAMFAEGLRRLGLHLGDDFQ